MLQQPITIYDKMGGQLLSNHSIVVLGFFVFHLLACSIEQFEHLDVEQTQQEQTSTHSASAVAVANFGDHVERSHNESNQDFIDEYEVTL